MDNIPHYNPDQEANRNVIWQDCEGDFWYYVADHGWTYTPELVHQLRRVHSSPRQWKGDVLQLMDFPWTPWGLWIDGKAHEGFDIPTSMETPEPEFVVKDSGAREQYANGFVRDTEDGKYDYARVLRIEGLHLIPIEALERWGAHMVKGAEKYGEDNWRQARGLVAIGRFIRSLCRHTVQFIRKDRTEDHAAAVCFNVWAAELTPEED